MKICFTLALGLWTTLWWVRAECAQRGRGSGAGMHLYSQFRREISRERLTEDRKGSQTALKFKRQKAAITI